MECSRPRRRLIESKGVCSPLPIGRAATDSRAQPAWLHGISWLPSNWCIIRHTWKPKWLEDFDLAETRSSSRSAPTVRHHWPRVFAAYSRNLEAWAGTDLVDRSSYAPAPAGETLYNQSLEMSLGPAVRRPCSAGTHRPGGRDRVAVHTPFTFSPPGSSSLREKFRPIKGRLIALNVHDAVLR
jgi:hypothetical protein